MKKKSILIIIGVLVLILGALIAYYKIFGEKLDYQVATTAEESAVAETTTASTDETTPIYATDENGETMTDSAFGNPVVYVTDEAGEIQTEENGEEVTEVYYNTEVPTMEIGDTGSLETHKVDPNTSEEETSTQSQEEKSKATSEDVIGYVPFS